MKLSKEAKQYLLERGYLEEDLAQIQKATSKKITVYEIDDKKASVEEVLEVLDFEEYLSGIGRSAFHWNCVRHGKNGEVVYFDSSKLFK